MSSTSEMWSRFAPPPPVLAERFKWSVFVSYGSTDYVWLVNLWDALRNAGHRLVVGQRTMTDAERAGALDQSLAGLLVWSSAPDWLGQVKQAEWWPTQQRLALVGSARRLPPLRSRRAP